jgi:5-bromo-4-chloroindolyl phosphate hydrolysis protein
MQLTFLMGTIVAPWASDNALYAILIFSFNLNSSILCMIMYNVPTLRHVFKQISIYLRKQQIIDQDLTQF